MFLMFPALAAGFFTLSPMWEVPTYTYCAVLCLVVTPWISPLDSSVHGDSPDKNTGVGCHAFLQEIFPTLGSDLLHCRQIYQLSHQGSPLVTPVAAAAKMLELCWTLCDPIDGSQPAPLSLGYSRQEYLEWVAISFSRGSSRHRDQTSTSFISRQIIYH